MKTLNRIYILGLFSISCLCKAQPAANNGSVLPPTPYSIVNRAANTRTWERTVYQRSSSGQIVPQKHRYIEVATGLCYQQNGSDSWLDSKAQIEIMPDGTAAATQGQHQAYFPSDIATGVITLITPDGKRLQSRPVGLSYDDGDKTVLVGLLNDSVGELVDSNQVVYPNAFEGVTASLRYTYTKAGFEQDVLVQGQLPSPAAYGLNPATTCLQVLTEFFDGNPTTQRILPVNPRDGLKDMTLIFGKMKMVQGKAFSIGEGEANNKSRRNGTPTYKSWEHVQGRNFLVEEVPYQRLAMQLSQLPASTVASTAVKGILNKVSAQRLLPVNMARGNTKSKIVQLAGAGVGQKPAVALDYVTTDYYSEQDNYTFQGDTTYYVDGELLIDGGLTIEGGAVVKFAPWWTGGDGGTIYLDDYLNEGLIVCQTAAYRPAIFTSMEDNSVGETIDGSSGTPEVNDVDVFFNDESGSDVDLNYLHFNYCNYAIYVPYSSPYEINMDIWNCQFMNLLCSVSGGNNVGLHNVLMNNISWGGNGPAVIFGGTSLTAENVTVDGDSGSSFVLAGSSGATVALTNCLITGEASIVSPDSSPATLLTNATYYSLYSSIYQSAGGGNYYLPTNSPYRGAGNTNISGDLLAQLRTGTTQPPMIYSNLTMTTNLTFGPQTPRDNTAALDLGYHYDTLDYIFGACDSHTNLTFAAGTAIGWFKADGGVGLGEPYAFSLNNGANASFNGTVTQPCFFVEYNTVQGGNGNWNDSGSMAALVFNGGTTALPRLSANFTRCMAGGGQNLFCDNYARGNGSFQNCEFYDTGVSTHDLGTVSFTNCLFYRNSIVFQDHTNSLSFNFGNCTFFEGYVAMTRSQSSSWQIENTAFDGTAFFWSDSLSGNTNYTAFDYNAYNTNNPDWQNYPASPIYGTLENVGPHDLKVPKGTILGWLNDGFGWQGGWLGSFYLPAPGIVHWGPYSWQASPLFDAGSAPADQLGLSWFTTQTSQIPEGASRVDIGYHYRSLDQNGNPAQPGNSVGTNFWLMFPTFSNQQLSLVISSLSGATGTVTVWTNGPILAVSGCGDTNVNGTYALTNLDGLSQGVFGSSLGYLSSNQKYIVLPGPTFYMLDTNLDLLYQATSPDLNGAIWVSDGDLNPPPVTSCAKYANVLTNFTVPAGIATNLILPQQIMADGQTQPIMASDYDAVDNFGIQVTSSTSIAVYEMTYVAAGSAAFTAYPTPLLGTNYCVLARPSDSIPGPTFSQLALVATASNTTVTIQPSPTAFLAGSLWTNSIKLQAGQTYQVHSSTGNSYGDDTNDLTGTWIKSDKPIAVFAGANVADIPDDRTESGNPLAMEQLPVSSWGSQALSAGFAGRSNGDAYRVLAAYSNTVVRITGKVVTITNEPAGGPWQVTSTNETVVTNLTVGQCCDVIVDGPVSFQASQPIQVAHFANGAESDQGSSPVRGDPCGILLSPTGRYLMTNIVYTLDNVTADFDTNYLNLIVPQSATNSTQIDGSLVTATNYVPIGTSGYYGARIPVTNSGTHTVTSPQAVGVEIYGLGYFDAYGYFGGLSQ